MAKEYIEREALKEDLKESYERLRAIYDSLTYNEDKQICAGQLTTFTEAILRVKEAPAADVVEVRHGRWEAWMPDKNGETREFICTGCRFMVEMSWKQKECDYEWCPYCGCKMDKEVADDKKQPEEAPGE